MITLSLPYVEPITLNTATKYRTRGKFVQSYKSPAYKDLIKIVNAHLRSKENYEALKEFNSYYDPKRHYITAEYRFYYPLITQKKTISKNSKDISNLIKSIEDILFDHLPNANDAEVIKVSAMKIHSEEVKTIIQLNTVLLSHIV